MNLSNELSATTDRSKKIVRTSILGIAANAFLALFRELAQRDYAELPIRILGPSPASVVKVSNKYRYKLIIKCRSTRAFRRLLSSVLIGFGNDRAYAKVSVYADMNALVC